MSISILEASAGRTLIIRAINGSMLSLAAIDKSKHDEIYKIELTKYVKAILETINNEDLSYEEKVEKAKSYYEEYKIVLENSFAAIFKSPYHNVTVRNVCNR